MRDPEGVRAEIVVRPIGTPQVDDPAARERNVVVERRTTDRAIQTEKHHLRRRTDRERMA